VEANSMPSSQSTHVTPLSLAEVEAGLDAIRAEFDVAGPMPAEVEDAAKAAIPLTTGRRDATNLAMVTLDPASSTDLDQAFAFSLEPGPSSSTELTQANIVLHYAIADIGAFAPLGGVVEAEAWKRGTTVYAPDGSVPVYPRILCQDRASLLPDGPRPCILLEVVVAPDGTPVLRNVERATVRSRAKLAYETTTKADLVPEAVELARRVMEAEDRRGAFNVEVQEQEVVLDASLALGLALRFAARAQSEDLNARISLAANMAVASAMIERGVGLFRVMNDPDAAELGSLRRTARTLGVAWARNESLRQVIPRLDIANPKHVAFSISARRSGGGASYAVFPTAVFPSTAIPSTALPSAVVLSAEVPSSESSEKGFAEVSPNQPPPSPASHQGPSNGNDQPRPIMVLRDGKPWHAAMAAPYAHATAPMRRLADRYVLELLLAEYSGDDATKAALIPKLAALPAAMADADHRAAKVNRACLDYAECVILRARVGETFDATIIEVSREIAQFTIENPCVVARIRVPKPKPGQPEVSPGDELTVSLDAVDPIARRLSFRVVSL
jgi:exoribonuclease R